MRRKLAAIITGSLLAMAHPHAKAETGLGHANAPAETGLDGEKPSSTPGLQPATGPDNAAVEKTGDVVQDLSLTLAREMAMPQADLWERIRNGFAFAEFDSRLVRENEAWYANRPDYVKRMADRARRYLFHIVEEVEKRGMPTEIALLPMIESAFNPQAYSRSHASGIWQFVASTGKLYGLRQNWWYDGRRDIVAATHAALDYLQYLHGLFGDWQLALAAYNWGEGAVARALLRNQAKGLPIDYQSLTMPAETRSYVPRLIAVKNIVSNPGAFGLQLESIPDRPYFEKVATKRHIDVRLAARLAEIPLDEFVALNPAHSRPVISASGSQTLLLPVENVATFLTNVENHDKPFVSWQVYTVRQGERLDKIAARFGLSAARLQEINGIPPRKRVGAGQTLLVPAKGRDAGGDVMAMKSAEPSPLPAPASSSADIAHTVRKGDTLFNIAKRYGVTPREIQSSNTVNSTQIIPGQKLVIRRSPSGRKKTVAIATRSSRLATARKPIARRGAAGDKKVVLADASRRVPAPRAAR